MRDNVVHLYNRIVLPDWPGLYFMGLLNLNGAANQAYERQAPWIVAIETGEAVLPTREEMQAAIQRKARMGEALLPRDGAPYDRGRAHPLFSRIAHILAGRARPRNGRRQKRLAQARARLAPRRARTPSFELIRKKEDDLAKQNL